MRARRAGLNRTGRQTNRHSSHKMEYNYMRSGLKPIDPSANDSLLSTILIRVSYSQYQTLNGTIIDYATCTISIGNSLIHDLKLWRSILYEFRKKRHPQDEYFEYHIVYQEQLSDHCGCAGSIRKALLQWSTKLSKFGTKTDRTIEWPTSSSAPSTSAPVIL